MGNDGAHATDDTDAKVIFSAVLINAIGSVLINSGTNLIRYGGCWKHVGGALFLIGNMLTFASMSLGPSSLLAAVSAVQFVSNVLWSYILFKEKPSSFGIAGTVIIIIADIIVLVCEPAEQSAIVSTKELLDMFWFKWRRRYFMMGCWSLFFGLVVLFGYLYQLAALPFRLPCCSKWLAITADDVDRINCGPTPACIFVMLSAVIGSQSVIVGKVLSLEIRALGEIDDWSPENIFRFGRPGFDIPAASVAWAFCISLWLVQLQRGLRFFKGSYVIPLQQACWIFWCIISAMITFEEYKGLTWQSSCGFGFGVLLLFVGVGLLSPREAAEQQMCGARPMASFLSSVSTRSALSWIDSHSPLVDLSGVPITPVNGSAFSVDHDAQSSGSSFSPPPSSDSKGIPSLNA